MRQILRRLRKLEKAEAEVEKTASFSMRIAFIEPGTMRVVGTLLLEDSAQGRTQTDLFCEGPEAEIATP